MEIKITKNNGRFIVDEKSANHLISKHIGSLIELQKEKMYVLDPLEVIYLFEKKNNIILTNFKISSANHFLKSQAMSTDEYIIFCDLQKKGYIVKQALKFGATFRIYKKENGQIESHASHLVFVLNQKKKIIPEELFSINRVAHSSKKKILLSFVDYEGSISYLEQSRWK